ncbi:guanine nucleotide-binding protein-like 3 homolog [Schistocerca americana]|uniref:guanine nucleotide-binding protein-like 3 homolog n=1 Tax=Schistocerca americana TaxID=7009 RepID=UPI001F5016C2|nr:guanine nucleotide-binding protein-like 3 homolog [Schistocerca americana]
MVVPNQCCCGCSLRTGTIIIAVLCTVWCLFQLAITAYSLHNFLQYFSDDVNTETSVSKEMKTLSTEDGAYFVPAMVDYEELFAEDDEEDVFENEDEEGNEVDKQETQEDEDEEDLIKLPFSVINTYFL